MQLPEAPLKKSDITQVWKMPPGFQILLRASSLFSFIQITQISMNSADLASAKSGIHRYKKDTFRIIF